MYFKKKLHSFLQKKILLQERRNALHVCDLQNHVVKPGTENLTSRGLVKFLMPYI